MRRSVAWLVLVAALSGCTSLDALLADDAPAAAPASVPGTKAARAAPQAPTPAPRLDVEMTLSEPWVKPRNDVEATASAAEAGVTWRWFVESNTTAVAASDIAGMMFLEGGEPLRSTPRERASTGLLAPGATSRAILLGGSGQWDFAAPRHPSVRFTIEVDPHAPATPVDVLLVRDDDGFRFHPPRATTGSGGQVRFENADALAHSVAEVAYRAAMPSSASSVSLVGVDPGWYAVTAVARAPDGREGEARRALLVDFETPSLRATIGPYSGELGVLPGEPAHRHEMRAAHPVRSLALQIELDDRGVPSGAPALLRVLDAEGAPLHEERVDDRREVELGALPEGAYTIEIARTTAYPQTYRIGGEIHYAPVRPAPPGWLSPE